MKVLNNFLLYIQFFTRIPINRNLDCHKENFRKGSPFLLIVGLIIGCLQGTLAYLLKEYFPVNIISIVNIALPIILTGALHLDGLGDMFDGFFAFKGGKDKIIEIMKDSRIGTFACAAIIIDILLKIALMEYFIVNLMYAVIVLIPLLSRFTIIFLAYIGKNAKEKGTGNILIGNIGMKQLLSATILTLSISTVLLGYLNALIAFVSAIIISIGFNAYCNNKIDGLTGDTLGANVEIVEILIGLVFILLNN